MKHGNTYPRLATVRGVDLTEASSVILSLKPRGRASLSLTKDDMAITSDGTDSTIVYKLTEQQSLYLGEVYRVDVNYMLDGSRGGTTIEIVRALPTLLTYPMGGGDNTINPDASEPDVAEMTSEDVRVLNAISPHVNTEQTETGAIITIKDIDGTHTVELDNGTPPSLRVESLNSTALSSSAVEAVGIPVYIKDVTQYADFGLTETGWYVFSRIHAKTGVVVTAETSITGAAGYIADIGNSYVDVAVNFDVAALSKTVTVNWGSSTETFVFKATDLAVRNLDYMARFYVYDISEYCTWTYALTTDTAFVADKNYYTEADGVYTLAEVTAGEAVPAYYKDEYNLTTDETFQDGVTYYTLADGVYIVATVTVGETVTAGTYYVQSKVRATGAFESGVTYYTLVESAYVEATVTAGEHIPAYYNHSKLTLAGMTPNVTYKLDETLDCPLEITLPEVNDDGHGAWFEIQMHYSGTWSCTLLPPTGVKIGTAQTQAQSAGINTIDLQYTDVDNIKMWTLLNTHSNVPT